MVIKYIHRINRGESHIIQQSVAIQVSGPKGKSTIVTLLNEQSIELTPTDLFIFSLFSASLNPHPKIVFLWQVVVNTETCNWSVCREIDTET